MADVDVKSQSSGRSSIQNPESERGGLQRQQSSTGQGSSGMTRGRGRDPYGFSSGISPYEFLTANPFSLMRRMSEEMDRAFGSSGQSGSSRSGSWYPAIDLTENNGQLQVHAELPGIKPEDIKVEIANDILTIQGERKSEHEHHMGKAYHSERRYGEFYREIALPEGVNADEVKANFNHGVLEISIPVPQQANSRKQIPISSSSAIGSSSSSSNATSSSGSQNTGSSQSTGSSQPSGSANAQAATGSGGNASRSTSAGGSR